MPVLQERHRLLSFLHQVVEQDTARLRAGRLSWSWWLEAAARHGRHGFADTLLICAQSPAATDVRSYEQWRARGRRVRRGESGIRILSPRGGPRAVFDVTQTEGDPIAVPAPATAAQAYERLRAVAAGLGLHVRRDRRWARAGRPDRSVHLDPALSDFGAATELAHQLAHLLRRGDRLDPREDFCHGTRRVEADSVAYLALAHLGLDTAHLVFPPVASWAGHGARSPQSVRQAGDRILRTASHLRRRFSPPGEAPPGGEQEPGRRRRTGHGPPRPPRTGERRAPDRPATPAWPAANARPTADAPHAVRQPLGNEDERTGPPPARPADLVAAHQAAHRFFRTQLPGSWVPAYLSGRGFDQDVQRSWQLGYAPRAWRALTDHLRALGHSDRTILAAGLARRTGAGALFDAFRDRLMFALRAADGTVTGFLGRLPDGAEGPKYLNSPHTPLFRKSDLLFGLHETRDRLAAGARPVIVEGPLDAIAVNIAEPARHAALAPCGTVLTAAQLTALGGCTDLDATGVLLALDGDAAGHAGMIRTWLALGSLAGPLDAVVLQRGHDPADLLRAGGPAAVRAALRAPVPLPDLVVDACVDRYGGSLEFAEQKLTAVRAATALIARMPAARVPRQVARLHSRTGVDTATITDVLTATITGRPV
ncbi:hypothetical protein DPM19_05215 [Actinomadura craniellae]|uniref:DNA primase DNAG catalytic core N-terminal domain-containing protein n=1 Tax=Actinomadura craniellae TaxID=2231787 RepID=A0A365HDF6_9ACTN|nr:toprim domain-containing protein [Actinomadura craniellae]RAY16293.1 hypothetical protein DPM19_05215 [Actinomadura craniellae]